MADANEGAAADPAVVAEAERLKNEANVKFKGAPPCCFCGREAKGEGLRASAVAGGAHSFSVLFGSDRAKHAHTHNLNLTTEKHYAAAVEGYTKAIELRPDCAAYFSNRAFAHMKLEEYGSVIADATSAIEADPAFVKVCVRVRVRVRAVRVRCSDRRAPWRRTSAARV